jgi:type VI secretion system protein VasG
MMDDGEGRRIDFKNNIIILTSNAGTDTLMKLCADPETMPSAEGLVNALKPELNKTFKPAFLGRLVIIPYFPIRDEALKKIIVLKLAKIQRRLQETHKIAITYDDGLIDEVARRCTEVESGARNVDNILTNTLLPEISKQILGRIAEGEKPQSIHVGIGEDVMADHRLAADGEWQTTSLIQHMPSPSHRADKQSKGDDCGLCVGLRPHRQPAKQTCFPCHTAAIFAAGNPSVPPTPLE